MVLCGGESGEHEVSLQSAASVMAHIPKDKYKVIPVGVDKSGQWWTGESLIEHQDDPANICLSAHLKPAYLDGGHVNGEKIDAIFSIIHGTFGEDGCMQGLFQMQHVPFVGPGLLGSAVGMDKDVMKRLLLQAGFDTADYFVVRATDTERPSYEAAKHLLGDILFVKPCNLGSSIGISKVTEASQYDAALEKALKFDDKILVESFIDGREIELSVLGNQELIVSVPGEIIPGGDFYSYETKYLDSEASKLVIPAVLDEDKTLELQDLAQGVFRCLELEGLSRVDVFLQADGQIWVNEVNTLPGFTSISMYPKLLAAVGITYDDLIDRLIQLALERHERKEALMRNRG